MEEEFQGGVCGGNSWWNLSRSLISTSPCSSEIIKSETFRWPINPIKTVDRSSDDSTGSASDGSSTAQREPIHGGIINWNENWQGTSEKIYSHQSESLNSSMNYWEIANHDLNPMDFCEGDFSVHSIKQLNQPPLNLPPSSLSILQMLFEDDHPQESFHHIREMSYSQMYSDVNNTTYWKAAAPPEFVPAARKSLNKLSSFNTKRRDEEERDLGKKSSGNHPATKRPRIQTPSPLPTFKVRKEKLSDRVTALQQLVSPFGKTDTASVLHETIDYIKFLHDQLHVLSAPYLNTGSAAQLRQLSAERDDEDDSRKQYLSIRGLSLVPISVIFPFTAQPSSEFWTPSFPRKN